MTSNIYLEQLALKHKIKLDYIVFKDELQKIPYNINLSIILNMSSTRHSGTHWLSLYATKNIIYYFDSFGIEPPIEVINWAKKYNKKIVFNDYDIQHLSSDHCGQLSLSFLAAMQGKYIKSLMDDSTII